mgnify:CR=1 FL=1
MTATFQSAAFGADDTLTVTLSNGNRMDIPIAPYLDCPELSPLKSKGVRKSLTVQDGCLCWKGIPPISASALLSLLREENVGCEIACANAGDDWRLYLRFQNGGSLSMEMEPLLEYSVFAPLVQRSLWKTLHAKEKSLLWEDESLRLELPIGTILRYFA